MNTTAKSGIPPYPHQDIISSSRILFEPKYLLPSTFIDANRDRYGISILRSLGFILVEEKSVYSRMHRLVKLIDSLSEQSIPLLKSLMDRKGRDISMHNMSQDLYDQVEHLSDSLLLC